jgi:phospholipase C
MRILAFATVLAFAFNIHAEHAFAVPGEAMPDCSRAAGSVPDQARKAGSPEAKIPVDHILVIMQENHTFDNYFGALSDPKHYGAAVDGHQTGMSNPDGKGGVIPISHAQALCPADPMHAWNFMHDDWNQGANDRFVINNGPWVMQYFDDTDIPFYYGLADRFAIGDRYFSSLLGPTYPNRYYLMTGTSFGQIENDTWGKNGFTQKTIFEVLNKYGVSWKYYQNGPGYLAVFKDFYNKNRKRVSDHDGLDKDLHDGTLPQVAFIDFSWDGEDEHPAEDVQVGQSLVAGKINALMNSPQWKNSVLFLTYDEGGGFWDHVAPPTACIPDAIAPVLGKDSYKAQFDRYGFRVPLVAVSPFAKRHYVSHHVYDHTSILKFIETKYNLPALSMRDANADGLLDMFDFDHPDANVVLPAASVDPNRKCGK